MRCGRRIVVGDIHGCYDELSALLERARFGPDDELIAVGDLVVKGAKNRAVLDLFIEDARFRAVLGNHDCALRDFWRGARDDLKPAQRRAIEELSGDCARYAAYLESLPLAADLGTHLIVHAGLRPGVQLAAQAEEDLTELRTLGPDRTSREGVPWYDVYDGDKMVLFGHWPAAEPRRGPRALGLDTGCVYGYELSAYVIETGELISVPARRAYAAPKGKL